MIREKPTAGFEPSISRWTPNNCYFPADDISIPSATPQLILLILLYPAAPIWCALMAVSLVATLAAMVLEGKHKQQILKL
jgi:hypothetical protein